jgi:hypothetical protein
MQDACQRIQAKIAATLRQMRETGTLPPEIPRAPAGRGKAVAKFDFLDGALF